MIGDLRKKLQPVGRLDVLDGVGLKALDYYAAQDLDRLDADSLGRRARALHMIGSIAEQRGHFDEATRDFQQAADTTSRLLKAHPDDPQRIFDQSQSEYWVGYILWYRGRLHEAEAAFRRYLDMAQRMNTAKPGDHDWQLESVYAKTNVAIVLTDLGRPAEAQPLLAQACDEIARIARSHPDDSVSEGNTIGWRAITFATQALNDEAIQAENDKIAAALRAPNADKDQDAQFLVANAHHEMGNQLRSLGRLDEAIASSRLALTELAVLNTRDPTNIDNVAEIIGTSLTLGDLLVDRGDPAAAREQLRDATARHVKLMSLPTPKRAWRIDHAGRIALLRARLAATPDERASADAALVAFLGDVYRYQADGGELPAAAQVMMGNVRLAHGNLLAIAGDNEKARAEWQATTAPIRPLAEHLDPAAMTLLAQLDLRLGGVQDARAWADRVQGTTYRHPAFADLQQRLGPTQQAGGASRP